VILNHTNIVPTRFQIFVNAYQTLYDRIWEVGVSPDIWKRTSITVKYSILCELLYKKYDIN
jgi:hypothetical protein